MPPVPGAAVVALPVGRFQSALPDGLDRAAREIYRNMRRSGASSREWLSLSWPGNKSGPAWVSAWTQCAEVDSYVTECLQNVPMYTDPDAYVDQCLDSSDVLEAILRSLAATVHYRKTQDSESADRMRGLVAPGDEIAPSWLIDGSIEYSRAIHRQKAYLHAVHHKPAAPSDKSGKGWDRPAPKAPKGPKAKNKAKKGSGRGKAQDDEDE